MKSFKAIVAVVLVSVVACGSDPGATASSAAQAGDASDQAVPPAGDGSTPGSEDATMADTGAPDGSGTADTGTSDTGTPDGGGTADTGTPDSGADSGGGGIVSNFHNFQGWNDPNACPAWNPTPYAWKEPRTTGIGSQVCFSGDVFQAGGLYDSFLSPTASKAGQDLWISTHAACSTCAISNWSDPTWGPVVRTPNGHYVLNQAGCTALKDPGRKSCALSDWQFKQCGKEACDSIASTDQVGYQSCVDTSSNNINGVCGEAAYGWSKAGSAIFSSGSAAWSQCISTGLADDARHVATRVVTGQCY